MGDLSLPHAFGGLPEPDRHPARALSGRVADLPGVRYLLLSLDGTAKPVLRSFLIVDGEVTEEELTIT